MPHTNLWSGGGTKTSVVYFWMPRSLLGAHSPSLLARMSFEKGISIGEEESEASSCLESIALKVQELEGIILDVEDVSARSTLESDLRYVYERAKEKAKKQVAIERKSRKSLSGAHGTSENWPGVSAPANARVATPKVVEDLYSVPDDLFAEFEYKP